MIQQVWQAHLPHLPKQKNHIAHALCAHLHMLLHLFPLPMKPSCQGSPSLSLSPSYPLGLFISLPDFFTFQTYISTKVPKYHRFCLQSSPLGYSYNTIFFSTEKMETGWSLVRMVSYNLQMIIAPNIKTANSFLRTIMDAFKVPTDRAYERSVKLFENFLVEQYKEGKVPTLFVDEAQN